MEDSINEKQRKEQMNIIYDLSMVSCNTQIPNNLTVAKALEAVTIRDERILFELEILLYYTVVCIFFVGGYF